MRLQSATYLNIFWPFQMNNNNKIFRNHIWKIPRFVEKEKVSRSQSDRIYSYWDGAWLSKRILR